MILETIELRKEKETMKVYLDEFMKCYRGINLLTKRIDFLNQKKLLVDREYVIGVMFVELNKHYKQLKESKK